MNTKPTFRGILFLITLASFLLAAALPQDVVFAQDVVRLTIINHSTRDIWLNLKGPISVYNLHVRAGETRSYTPIEGVYDYTYYACGTWVKGKLDLTTHLNFEVPNCGYLLGGSSQDHPNYIDAGEIIKLVNVTLENKTGAYALMIMNGPSVFVFSFQPDQKRDVTIPKGDYSFTVYGCAGSFNGSAFANYHNLIEIKCP